eukprot:CAMPEP_0195135956 /NCGR_PEP_ID=MMETSP0448-20130528/153378_1 /TAXON_ID=66468 /ORGANISM="Heterocapsa triquestra, Strain CCMP 448" /LENGTH=117 /DNA_ID=CAMNT_0040174121 /DNA_START=36 /DNA_END=385 /DNA_ORIENTATION=+
MGHPRDEIMRAITDLTVTYSPLELRQWAQRYDVIAVQEVDPPFLEALGEPMRSSILRGDNDRDARGVVVDSFAGLVLHPDRGTRVVRDKHAKLSFRSRSGRPVTRDMVAALLERPDG